MRHRLRRATDVEAPRQKSLVFHDDAVRCDDGTLAHIGAVEKHRPGADVRKATHDHLVDLQHAILERVRLEKPGHRRVVFNLEHVGIDHLRKPGSEHHAPPDL
jgi:hypothetical protein